MPLMVSEIFYSIQGESLYAGLPCVFVRLAGCNLRCTYCDTRYAQDSGTAMSIQDILDQVAGFSCLLVEITGGEPLLQDAAPALVDALIANGYTVLMETNGSMDISRVHPLCIKILDIKCPGSGQSHQNDLNNLTRLGPGDQVKFVLSHREDFEFATALIAETWKETPPAPVLFSPVQSRLDPAALAEWILREHLNVRLQLQMHKIIWPDVERGK
jgi:7-carboxy-7-deazaguanine synthase